MAKVISFANQKGGVGKSTLCIQQAFYLALQKKKKSAGLGYGWSGGTRPLDWPPDESLRMVTTSPSSQEPKPQSCSLTSWTALRSCTALAVQTSFIRRKNDPDLFEMEAVPLDQAMNPARHLAELFENYDYVLIDCPPSLGRKLVAALVMSTHVACPVKLSGFAVDGVEGLLNTIIGVREAYNQDLEILGIVINDMDRSVNHDKALKSLENTVPDLLFENKIMHRPPLDTATTDGIPVWELRYGHVAAKEVEAVLEELLEKVG